VYNYFTFDRRARLITEMTPSPADVTNHTEDAASEKQLARKNRQAQFAAK
jgi:hypothetical protein